jgi:hypothetical protein
MWRGQDVCVCRQWKLRNGHVEFNHVHNLIHDQQLMNDLFIHIHIDVHQLNQ